MKAILELSGKSKTWLVTGASGLLGYTLCSHLVALDGIRVVGQHRSREIDIPGVEPLVIDLTDLTEAQAMVGRVKPDVIVHTAGLTNVDLCEDDPGLAHRIHVEVSETLAAAGKARGGRFAHISTDHLWDGRRPFVTEEEPLAPLNVYGKTKGEGEGAVLAADPSALIVRTNFFGPGRPWRLSFSDWILAGLREGRTLNVFDDVFFTPIALPHLVSYLTTMIEKEASGLYHVAGGERVSKYAFARRLAERVGLPVDAIISASVADAHLKAPRPKDMSLNTDKAAHLLGHSLPGLDAGLAAIL